MSDTSKIPKGYYCYEYIDNKQVTCPYWDLREDLPVHENGYCAFLGKSDVDLNKEEEDQITEISHMKDGVRVTEKMRVGDIGITFSLLWDQCKECGQNMEDEEMVLDSENCE